VTHHQQHEFVVVDAHDALAASRFDGHADRVRIRQARRRDREIDVEGRATTQFAAHADVAMVTGHDAVHHG